jgi:hypothetical protein
LPQGLPPYANDTVRFPELTVNWSPDDTVFEVVSCPKNKTFPLEDASTTAMQVTVAPDVAALL